MSSLDRALRAIAVAMCLAGLAIVAFLVALVATVLA